MKRTIQKSLVLFLFLTLLFQAAQLNGMDIGGVSVVRAAPYSYTNTVAYNVPDGTSAANNGCAYWPATRYFLVDDYFTVNDLNVEFSQSHTNRGQIQVRLTAPNGTTQVLVATSGDTWNNYYITLDADITGALNDGNDDTIGGTRRNVQQTALNAFDGINAHGHWTMTICDNTYTGSNPSQLFNAATLVFDGTATATPSYTHQQGPGLAETYIVPWPEDQVWTAFGRIFPSSCTNYNSFRDNYDAAPRLPMVSYIVMTTINANTVIYYDQWEDGYETALTFPRQGTTQVWGDGILTNGTAPGDTDDILPAGSVITLNDVMLTATLGTIVDYDGRDKIGTSSPISLSRSVWSDGSQTMFAAADQVYPIEYWGTQFYSPVGDNANLNGMFDFSGASIIAAVDGTLVDIDKDANGTYETTGIALNQGQTYFIDDNTTGLYRGGGIRSNAGHPIQVNLMTANTCAGYESRTYPLLPFDQWDSSYYTPVGTPTTNPGAPANDDVPTTVHLYNPNGSTIYVARETASGYIDTTTIATNSGANVVMANGTAARFYSTTGAPTTNNVRDQFTNQAYTNNDGSVNWLAGWDETGDDDSASAGTIYINTTSDHLRFRESSAAGDSITRQANLSGYATATLSFDIDGNTIDATDDISVLISSDGTNFTELERFDGDPGAVTRSYTITNYISTQTTVQFLIRDPLETGTGDGNYWQIDNVNISFTAAPTPATSVFYAIGSVDSDNAGGTGDDQNSVYDWGFDLVSEKVMGQSLVIGWAPGDDPTFQGSLAENTAPIWLTGGYPAGSASTGTFQVCVDHNGNGGALTDPYTGRTYDAAANLAPRAQLKIYKDKLVPPGTGAGTAGDDQTGTLVWVCDGRDAIITAAWGGDPLVSSPSKPGLDMGYTARNIRSWHATKGVSLVTDADNSNTFTEGDTLRYTITVRNLGVTTLGVNTLVVSDVLPATVGYVANSTWVDYHNATPNLNLTDGTTTPFPLDEGGYTYSLALPSQGSFQVYFDAVILANGGLIPPYSINNQATVNDQVGIQYLPAVALVVDLSPTAVSGVSGSFLPVNNSIQIKWETLSEFDITGFRLYRENNQSGMIYQTNARLIGSLSGTTYQYTDTNVTPGTSYTYWLEVRFRDGSSEWIGPTTVLNPYRLFVPFTEQ